MTLTCEVCGATGDRDDQCWHMGEDEIRCEDCSAKAHAQAERDFGYLRGAPNPNADPETCKRLKEGRGTEEDERHVYGRPLVSAAIANMQNLARRK